MKKNLPIGFFDSGVGGLSVLKKALEILPNENYVYFGDSKNAPYGTKTEDEIINLSQNAVEILKQYDVKAIVIACNTATSIASGKLREIYNNIPILGIEPAVKPALQKNKGGITLVMATPMTLSKGKFISKLKEYQKKYNVEPMPCYGLAEMVEDGNIEGYIIEDYLKNILKECNIDSIDNIVLGCTHYPFISKTLYNFLNKNIEIIDGSEGTINNLRKQLECLNLLNESTEKGYVKILNSSDKKDMIKLSEKLLYTKI